MGFMYEFPLLCLSYIALEIGTAKKLQATSCPQFLRCPGASCSNYDTA